MLIFFSGGAKSSVEFDWEEPPSGSILTSKLELCCDDSVDFLFNMEIAGGGGGFVIWRDWRQAEAIGWWPSGTTSVAWIDPSDMADGSPSTKIGFFSTILFGFLDFFASAEVSKLWRFAENIFF